MIARAIRIAARKPAAVHRNSTRRLGGGVIRIAK
jgi:hypothetical protein